MEIIGQTAREALTELRRLLGVLRGPADLAGRRASTSPSPSVSELEEVLMQVRQAGIAVDLRVEGSPSKLAPGVDLTAYRIVQEALTNTVRHSGAAEAAVTVSYEPGYVTVSVTDTGNGPVAATDGPPAKSAAADLREAPNGSGSGRPRPADSGWPASPSGSPPAAAASPSAPARRAGSRSRPGCRRHDRRRPDPGARRR